MKNKNKIIITFVLASMLLSQNVMAKTFRDVTIDGPYKWVYKSLDELSKKRIFGGYEDGTFRPERPVSFLEIMQVIKNIKNPSQEELNQAIYTFKDSLNVYNIPNWAMPALCYNLSINTLTLNTIDAASKRGFLNAKNTIYPDRNTVTVYFARSLDLSPNGDISLLKHKDINSINEMTKGYLASLVEAKIYSQTGSDGFFNGKKFIRRAEVAVISERILNYKSSAKANKEKTPKPVENKIEVQGIVTDINYENGNEFGNISIDNKSYKFDIQNLIVEDSTGIYSGNLDLMDKKVLAKVINDEIKSLKILSESNVNIVDAKENIKIIGKIKNIYTENNYKKAEVLVLSSDSQILTRDSIIKINLEIDYSVEDNIIVSGRLDNGELKEIQVEKINGNF